MAVQAIELTYDRLVYLSPSGKIEPYLASSWTITPELGHVHDPQGPDVRRRHAGHPERRRELAQVRAGEVDGGPVPPVRRPGRGRSRASPPTQSANTVTVTLTKPYNALLTSFSVPFATPIICPAGLANPKGLSAAPQGSGPYVLDKSRSQRGSHVRVHAAQGLQLGARGLDGAEGRRPADDHRPRRDRRDDRRQPVRDGRGRTSRRCTGSTSRASRRTRAPTRTRLSRCRWAAGARCSTRPPDVSAPIRRCVTRRIWRSTSSSMVKAAFSNLGVAFNTMVTPQMQCYNPAVGNVSPGYDVAQAKQILEQDGYKLSGGVMTKNGKPLKLQDRDVEHDQPARGLHAAAAAEDRDQVDASRTPTSTPGSTPCSRPRTTTSPSTRTTRRSRTR